MFAWVIRLRGNHESKMKCGGKFQNGGQCRRVVFDRKWSRCFYRID